MSDTGIKNDSKGRSFFLTLNNPENCEMFSECHTEQEICDQVIAIWVADSVTRSCAVRYCISAEGLKHLHIVVEDIKQFRFSAVKKCFPSAHIEPTLGNKAQAEDYINKRGKWEEKGEVIVAGSDHGMLSGRQGKSGTLDAIEDLLEKGLTPNSIVQELGFVAERYSEDIKNNYFRRKDATVPEVHDNTVIWHTGLSGSGKSYYCHTDLIDQYGKENIYFISGNDYPFDEYIGEPVLVIDEYRHEFRYNFLLKMLDIYKFNLPCRYHNKNALWSEVHITSVLNPLESFEQMVSSDKRQKDSVEQLYRRIDEVWVHEKTPDHRFIYHKYSMQDYKLQFIDGWHKL